MHEHQDLYEMSVFGLRKSHDIIPLHDHPRMYGFIRPLYGRVRISTYSWLAPEEERALIAERKREMGGKGQIPGEKNMIRRPARYAGKNRR